MRRVLLAALLVPIVAASVASAAPDTRVAIPTAGASIAVPATWKALNARTVANSAAMNRLIAQNPSLRPFLAQLQSAGSPVKLMAFDLNAAQQFATNVNVVVAPSPGLTLPQLAAAYEPQLRRLLPSVRGRISTRLVSLPATRAVRASYRIGLSTSGRTLTVQTLQYIALRRGKSIVITFSTLPGQAASRQAMFTAIARSLRFG